MKKNKIIKTYCDNCKCEVDAYVISDKETFCVLGEDIEINTEYLKCPKCEEKIFNEELDNKTLQKAYKKYRTIHNLLNPEEIKSIREKYDLSQNEFSNLLGWGEKTICRYENGAIQDNVHNDLLRVLKDKNYMRIFLEDHKNNVSEKTRKKVLAKINSESYKVEEMVGLFFSYEPSVLSGFKEFDYDKLCSMISFFTERIEDLSITKLFKLLNYADNLYFKENCISISGMKYIHKQYGPVPNEYQVLLYILNNDNTIKEDYIVKHYDTHVISRGSRKIDSALNKEELDVLNRVYNKFKDYTASQISKASHKEKGYFSTKDLEFISYEYAEDLSI